jgi:hypothetical protein
MKKWAFAVVLANVCSLSSQVFADGPVIAFGAERQEIRSTPILERENRPLHFYGNTVRRRHTRHSQATAAVRPTSTVLSGR